MTAAERLGANLRRIRKTAGISQEALSYRAEVHRTQITMYETGERMPSILSLVKLAGACSATPNDLLAGLRWAPGEFLYGRLRVDEDEAQPGGARR